jgi:hypothetical protein
MLVAGASAARTALKNRQLVRQLPMRVKLREGGSGSPVEATVHEVKWCAQRNRCLEATGVPRFNPQSPSELNGDCALIPGTSIASVT